ncbi:MAG: nucleotidyltransferase domain-containing protein [Actinobacteria bacterium]|nr:nucleotidyltransferase domain-containing protein [Actinomycetota bacterium]
MDLSRPLTALFPGVQGRVLQFLAGSDEEYTGRRIAAQAGTSPSQTWRVLRRLTELGVVDRRDVPPAALYRLAHGTLVATALLDLRFVTDRLIHRMAESADAIEPTPVNITIFGSVARGTSHAGSDIDVLVIHADNVDPSADPWLSSINAWRRSVGDLVANSVEVVQAGETEAHDRLTSRTTPLWNDIVIQGRHVFGSRLEELLSSHEPTTDQDGSRHNR